MWYNIWEYVWTTRWSKDLLRANVLFIVLVLIYQLFHFRLQMIGVGLFFRCWLLMNICLLAKAGLDHYLL